MSPYDGVIAIGIDPGAGITGIAVRVAELDPRLLGAQVITRDKPAGADTYGRWMFTDGDLEAWHARNLELADVAIVAAGATCLEAAENAGGEVLHELLVRARGTANKPALARAAVELGLLVIGVEGIIPPNSARGMLQPSYVIATAMLAAELLGVLRARYSATIRVSPGGNGAGHPTAYPEFIRPNGARGTGAHLGGPSKHARSAWDVAGGAIALERYRRQTTSPLTSPLSGE